jgi:hypothetical protein
VINNGTSTFNLLGPSSGNNSVVAIFDAIAGVSPVTATSSGLFFDYRNLNAAFIFGSPDIVGRRTRSASA